MTWGKDGPLDGKGAFPKESNELLLCGTDVVADLCVFGEGGVRSVLILFFILFQALLRILLLWAR